MYSITTPNGAKSAAKSLRKRLKRDGVAIPNSLALEAVSSMMGYRNWNATTAALTNDDSAISPLLGIQQGNEAIVTSIRVQEPSSLNDLSWLQNTQPKTPMETEIYEMVAACMDSPHRTKQIHISKSNNGIWIQTSGLADAERKLFQFVDGRNITTVSKENGELHRCIHIVAGTIPTNTYGVSVFMAPTMLEHFLMEERVRDWKHLSVINDIVNQNFTYHGQLSPVSDYEFYTAEFIDPNMVYIAQSVYSRSNASAFYIDGKLHIPSRGYEITEFIKALRVG